MSVSPIINKGKLLGSLREALIKKVAPSESKAIQLDLSKELSLHKLHCKVKTLIGGAVNLEVSRQVQKSYHPPEFTTTMIGEIPLDKASQKAIRKPDEKSQGRIDNFFRALDHIINTSINDHKPDLNLALKHFKDFAEEVGKSFGQTISYSKTQNRHSYTIKLKAKDSRHILDLLAPKLLYPFLNQWSAALRKDDPNTRVSTDGKSVASLLFSRLRPLSTEGILCCSIEKGNLVLSYSEPPN